jgi:hypothetical protein
MGAISVQMTQTPAFVLNAYDEDNLLRFRSRVNYTSNFSQFDLDLIPPTNTSGASFRFFRHANTSGTKAVLFYRGNGTTQVSAQLGVDGENSFFQVHGGNFGIGTNDPARTLHVNAIMRLQPISAPPASPAQGDIYYDSSLNKLRVYDGFTWQNLW